MTQRPLPPVTALFAGLQSRLHAPVAKQAPAERPAGQNDKDHGAGMNDQIGGGRVERMEEIEQRRGGGGGGETTGRGGEVGPQRKAAPQHHDQQDRQWHRNAEDEDETDPSLNKVGRVRPGQEPGAEAPKTTGADPKQQARDGQQGPRRFAVGHTRLEGRESGQDCG